MVHNPMLGADTGWPFATVLASVKARQSILIVQIVSDWSDAANIYSSAAGAL